MPMGRHTATEDKFKWISEAYYEPVCIFTLKKDKKNSNLMFDYLKLKEIGVTIGSGSVIIAKEIGIKEENIVENRSNESLAKMLYSDTNEISRTLF
jgi:hypothetical protein